MYGGVYENVKVLSEGMQVDIRNGKQTLFWDHRWATSAPSRT